MISEIGPAGRWICQACGFQLTTAILRASDGAVGVNRRPVEDICPNDGTSMRPITWEEDAADANRVALEQMKRADELEALLLQRAQEIERLKWKEWQTRDHLTEAEAQLTAQAQEIAQVQVDLRWALGYVKQSVAASHYQIRDPMETCQAASCVRLREVEQRLTAEAARVSRAPQVEPPCDKVCQDCGSIFTIGELEREDRAVWGHPCRDSKGWSNPIDEPSSGRERRCESFRAPVQPARAPQPEQD